MKLFKIPLLLIWRLWFYILMFVSLLIFFPFLLIFTIKEEHYPIFWKFARLISKILIYGMGFRIDLTADEKIDVDKSYMFCPNHASLLDPFVLIVLSKRPIVFVGKKELVKIPVFGFSIKEPL